MDAPGGSDSKESVMREAVVPFCVRVPGGGRGNRLQYSCLEVSWTEGYSPWLGKEVG